MRRSRVPRSGRPSISQQQFEAQFLALSPQRLAVGERDRVVRFALARPADFIG
jgi:hypothetical protein